MCLGAQKAVKDAGRSSSIFLTAADGQKEALKAILDGTNYGATGLNNSDKIGRMGLHRLLDILDGKSVEKDTVVPSPEITKGERQAVLQREQPVLGILVGRTGRRARAD